jgi:diguanylate cyclase (GGDEF)-like protein/PAS domain S-box-containing protein
MRAATKEQTARDGFLPFRRDYLTIEIAIVVAIILTAFASYYRDPLVRVEQAFTPLGDGTAYYSYHYGDERDGGTSAVVPDAKQRLAWTCNLTRTYQYGYCGFGLMFDTAGSGHGIDLSRFERVKIAVRYEGTGRTLRVSLKNKDSRYLALGAPSDEMVIATSLPIRPGSNTIEVRLDRLTVPDWWRAGADPGEPELAQPDYHNVVAMEFLTGIEADPGRHRLRIEQITFHGSAAGAEAWYGGLALVWLLMIGAILFHRRREAAAWRNRLLASMRTIVDTIPHMVWSLDRDGKVYVNQRWDDFTGTPLRVEGGALGLRRLVHRDDLRATLEQWTHCVRSGSEFDVQLRIRDRSGAYRWVLARALPARDAHGATTGWYGTCTDVHDRVLAQHALRNSVANERRKSRQLKWASEHDALTHLPNRRAFEARLKHVVRKAQESGEEAALLVIDIDYFKHVNDTLGHGAGDEFLRKLADGLKCSVRHEDFVARIGGDEFAVILANLPEGADIARLGADVAAAIQRPLNVGGHVVRPGASIGGAIFPRDASNADDFLKRADAALYDLKRSGRGGFRLFQRDMLDKVTSAALQLARAREAIAEHSIVAVYQPKVALRGGAVIGFEALLRYSVVPGKLEPPETLAEAFGHYDLAAKIGEQMQRRVARDVRRWIDEDLRFGRVSINAAPAEFLRDDYAERLLGILAEHAVPPECIEVEVTEHAFAERGPEYVARALHLLKSAGVAISLDDFGTGYSSLSHMRDFPVDLIKIDRSYTCKITEDDGIAALVAGVVHLACGLGLEVVAEGVETEQQFELLRAMGCNYAQGHLLGLPLDVALVADCIAKDRSVKTAA